MSESPPLLQVFNVDLPECAPRVRITAGLGSVAQKTWNLRRPVTLIGSRRPSHIVLHDRDISPAHCVIVNTGTELLLKDLYTTSGTLCNTSRIDLTILKDGDVITVGENKIQVAVQVPEDTANDPDRDAEPGDPTIFRSPVAVELLHTDQRWIAKDAIVLIGRHERADIVLDQEHVSRRHAIIFQFRNGPAAFDLGGENGILVNGCRCSIAPLSDGDRITVGPFGLQIAAPNGKTQPSEGPAAEVRCDEATLDAEAGAHSDRPAPTTEPQARPELNDTHDPSNEAAAVESELDALKANIAQSWGQLNSWQSQLLDNASTLSRQETDLTTREAELDAKDAMLRGQLHDVTRYREQLAERERMLSARFAQLQADQEKLAEQQAECVKQEAENVRRHEELSRREHVFAQRWSRLHSATCVHCGKLAMKGAEGGNPSASLKSAP